MSPAIEPPVLSIETKSCLNNSSFSSWMRDQMLTVGLVLGSIASMVSLTGCQSDYDYYKEATPINDSLSQEELRELVGERVSVTGETLYKTHDFTKQKDITERQRVFGPHYNAFEGEFEIGWHWKTVKVGEETVMTGGIYHFDNSKIELHANNFFPEQGSDIAVGELKEKSDSQSPYVEVGRFLNSQELDNP